MLPKMIPTILPSKPTLRSVSTALVLFVTGCGAENEIFPAAPAADRDSMVAEQIEARGITAAAVLAAMRAVPRHEFLPARLRHEAYADYPLPIGHGQTISQPYIVAFMTEAIRPQPGERILEIGAGSGYQAAVLSQMGAEVYTIEIVEPLAELARQTLQRLGYDKASVRHGDGHEGWPEHAPFDAIIVTCAPDKIPPALVEQLRDGGRMIIPVGSGMEQELVLLRKNGDQIEQKSILPVRFVPMTGEPQL